MIKSVKGPQTSDFVIPQRLRVGQFLSEDHPKYVSFADDLRWEDCHNVDWEAACRRLMLDSMDELKAQQAASPDANLVEARLFSEREKEGFPEWNQEYHAGCLFDRAEAWHELFASFGLEVPARLQTWITNGYSAYIDLSNQKCQPRESTLSQEELLFAQEQVDKWLRMGALQVFDEREKHEKAIICNCVVAYRNGKMDRICWSGVPVNQGLDDQSFKMESIKEICALCQPGDWAFSFDLEKGFQQVPLKGAFAQFCLFRLGGTVYKWLVLPQGLKSAPRDFSYIVRSVLKILRSQGIRCAFYIDDIICFAKSESEAIRLRQYVLDIFYKIGFRVSLKKSLLVPGQLIKHLGFQFDVQKCELWVTEEKAGRIVTLARDLLSNLDKLNGYKVAKFLGVLHSNRQVLACASMFSTGIATSLQQLPTLTMTCLSPKKIKKWRSPLQSLQDFQLRDFNGVVVLSKWAVAELRFWSKCMWQLRHVCFGRRVGRVVFTDACPEGFGALICLPTTLGCPENPVFAVAQLLHGAWLDKCDAHSTTFELRTLVRVLLNNVRNFSGQRVHVATDNVGAAFVAGKGCGSNLRLHYWAGVLQLACLRYDIQLSTQYLCGDGIIVSGADALSRSADPYACVLCELVFQKLWQQLGPFDVDVWASEGARQRDPQGILLPCVSPFAVKGRIAVDALSFSDHSLYLYAFPPSNKLDQYVEFLVRHEQPAVLIVPEWVGRSWWATLVDVGGPRVRLGKVADVIMNHDHPFGRQFDFTEAMSTVMWAVALFWPENRCNL